MRLVVILIAGLLAAAPAEAQVVYSVFGVRQGDMLNMRAQPSAYAPIVQAIPFNGEGIVLSGRTAPNGWVEAIYQRRRGWVNGRFLGFGGAGRYQLPAFLDCSGTEPFWSIGLAPGTARAEMMFAERRYFFRLIRAQQAMNRTDIWLIRGAARPGDLRLIVRHEACNDGMSDNRYPFSTVAMISGLNMVAGCCRPAVPR